MRILSPFLLLALAAPQDDAARQVREILEKLRSEKIEVREEAGRRLKELGKVAVPALKKASHGADSELAARARHLLRAIGIRQKLSPRLELHAFTADLSVRAVARSC